MAVSTEPTQSYSNSERFPADYVSMMLQMYLENLERASMARVLDLGPVCDENIMFFAKRVKRLDVCDMFLRLDRSQRKGLATEKVWKHLDYAPYSFAGIHLWDLIDHLDDNAANRLVELCHGLLKSKGMLMVISFEEHARPSQINSFVIQNDYQLSFRLQTHLNLASYYRNNRALTNMLAAFSSVKSFLYRNGVREFLCKRN